MKCYRCGSDIDSATIDACQGDDIVCPETKAPPTGFVVFGASGDLAHRKLYSSLFELHRRELLDENFFVLGCGRKEITDDDFRENAQKAIRKSCSCEKSVSDRFSL